ncbi:hypothetical protein PGT21_020873 [Puccinia graminis f. sp. tritici]|uniref:Uncharacterized protein n=1 Tax=Puccinia graminis f. sp. tritici TaxID=56615 RepID=A0A5B0Q673_PUCGR|nr:hypothetical protein PGT21_020873 [Puccinia graminis f. sp. tritici]
MSYSPLNNNVNPRQQVNLHQHGQYPSLSNLVPDTNQNQQQFIQLNGHYGQHSNQSIYDFGDDGLQLLPSEQIYVLPNLQQPTVVQFSQSQQTTSSSSNRAYIPQSAPTQGYFETSTSKQPTYTPLGTQHSPEAQPTPHQGHPQQNPAPVPTPLPPVKPVKKPRKKTIRQYAEANPNPNPAPAATSTPQTPAALSIATPAPDPTTRESVARFLAVPNSNTVPSVRVPPTLESYASKTIDELRAIALAKSKKVMTRDDELYFFQYHELQKTELTLAAINRGVSMSMVESLMGWKQAMREASGWNNFQTKNGHLFEGKGKGVKDSGVMKLLSTKWNGLTPEERAAYQTKNLPHIVDQDETTMDASTDAPDLAMVTGLRAHSKSLKLAEKRVDNFMTEWNKKVNHNVDC